MARGYVDVLEPTEWTLLQKAVLSNMQFLAASQIEMSVLSVALSRTILYKKFEETIPFRQFWRGALGHACFGVRCHRASLWRARDALVSRGILWIKDDVVRLNAVGLVNIVIRILESGVDLLDEDPSPVLKTLRSIEEKLAALWRRRSWDLIPVKVREEQMGLIEDEVMEARKRSKEAKDKNLKKREEREMKVAWIRGLMQEYCNEYGNVFLDSWTAKDYGSAKNWLDYCKKEGVRPADVLRDVCRLWQEFAGRLKNERGERIQLSENVSFTKFFKYRREIADWIVMNPGAEQAKPLEPGSYEMDPVTSKLRRVK